MYRYEYTGPTGAMGHSRHTLLTRTCLPALRENGSAHPFLLCRESVPITGSVLDIYIVCHSVHMSTCSSVSDWSRKHRGRRATKLAVAGPAGGTRGHTPKPLSFMVPGASSWDLSVPLHMGQGPLSCCLCDFSSLL